MIIGQPKYDKFNSYPNSNRENPVHNSIDYILSSYNAMLEPHVSKPLIVPHASILMLLRYSL